MLFLPLKWRHFFLTLALRHSKRVIALCISLIQAEVYIAVFLFLKFIRLLVSLSSNIYFCFGVPSRSILSLPNLRQCYCATFISNVAQSCHCMGDHKLFSICIVIAILEACCISSLLPVGNDHSGRNLQLLLPIPNLCDSTRRVTLVWIAKLPFYRAVQGCRHPFSTFGVEGFD